MRPSRLFQQFIDMSTILYPFSALPTSVSYKYYCYILLLGVYLSFCGGTYNHFFNVFKIEIKCLFLFFMDGAQFYFLILLEHIYMARATYHQYEKKILFAHIFVWKKNPKKLTPNVKLVQVSIFWMIGFEWFIFKEKGLLSNLKCNSVIKRLEESPIAEQWTPI